MNLQAAPFLFRAEQMGEPRNEMMTCRRCGTCCQKGGPALHTADLDLVLAGNIPLSFLYTLRKGESAIDNISGVRVRLASEIVKIKSRAGSTSCVYLNGTDLSCDIYSHRPLECRALECWNTDLLVKIYNKNRLTRKDLLGNLSWLQDLIAIHEDECGLSRIEILVADRAGGDPGAAEGLSQMIRYDHHLRDLLVEKGKIGPDLLGFLLGRPLEGIINRQFGVKIQQSPQDSGSS